MVLGGVGGGGVGLLRSEAGVRSGGVKGRGDVEEQEDAGYGQDEHRDSRSLNYWFMAWGFPTFKLILINPV